MHPMFTRVVEIQVHLAGIGMREFAEFQVHNDEASKQAMEENQITRYHSVPTRRRFCRATNAKSLPSSRRNCSRLRMSAPSSSVSEYSSFKFKNSRMNGSLTHASANKISSLAGTD